MKGFYKYMVSKPKAETKQDLARWGGDNGLKDYLEVKKQYMLIPSRFLGRLIYLVINEYFSNAEMYSVRTKADNAV